MLTSIGKRKVTRTAAALAAAGLGIASLALDGPSAGADPKQYVTHLVGAGSDTTQDIMNALSGHANGRNYPPIQSSAATGQKQVTSWDATGTTCVTPKAPGATINRANGSSAGRRALSRSIDGTGWGTTACGAGTKVISGLIDFARSSAGPSGTGTQLTYLPFGRDGMSFGYYANGVAPVTTLTSAQLSTLFKTGPQTISGVEIVPCGIQTGSGTYQFWNTAVGMTAAEEDFGTTTCNALLGRAQENDAAALKARGDLLVGKQVVIGFSAANFISQSNGVAASQLAAGVDLGAIDALGVPYTGVSPNTTPSATFYASATYGRDVYNVLPTSKVGGLAGANQDVKTLFVGATSAICSAPAQGIVNAFGFVSVANCGDISLQGPLMAGTI